MDYLKKNSEIWDEQDKVGNIWTIPVTSEEVQKAREGQFEIRLTPKKTVPKDWFPENIGEKKILCLASGGGQQGPILAATGADVTVFDYSKKQLEKDEYVAKRDNLKITLVQGNMKDLSVFENESFDCIVHPWSNGYVDDVNIVWRECARVLKKNGILISGFGNPVTCIFNVGKYMEGIFEVENTLPYADIEHLDDPKTKEIAESGGYIWSHTLDDLIGGQIKAGFAITGFYEDNGCDPLDKYMDTSMATKAIKL